jgi:hypothetical protein
MEIQQFGEELLNTFSIEMLLEYIQDIALHTSAGIFDFQ